MELKRKEPRTDITRRYVKVYQENGMVYTIEHSELMDGKWEYGDKEVFIIDKRKNNDDENSITSRSSEIS